jgi:hypothetical protein
MKTRVLAAILLKELASYLDSKKQWAKSTVSHCIVFPRTSENERDVTTCIEGILLGMKADIAAAPVSANLLGNPDFISHALSQPYSLRPNLVRHDINEGIRICRTKGTSEALRGVN